MLWTLKGGEPVSADLDSTGAFALVGDPAGGGKILYVPMDLPIGSSLNLADMRTVKTGMGHTPIGIAISPDDSYALVAVYGGRVHKVDLQTASYDVTSSSGAAPTAVVLGNGASGDLKASEAVDGCGTNIKLGGSYYAKSIEFLDMSTFIVAGWCMCRATCSPWRST